MTEPCPCCDGTGLATAPVDPVEQLAALCRERGLWVRRRPGGAHGRRGELLNVSEQWLRRRLLLRRLPVPSRRVGRHRLWRLADIEDV